MQCNSFFVKLGYILLWGIPYFIIIMRNSLLKTDLLILLSTPQKIETKTLEKAYVQFVNKLQVFVNNSSDLATSYFLLHYTRIE